MNKKILIASLVTLASVAATVGVVGHADRVEAATSETLYLVPSADWKQSNARFAAYFFGNGEKWVSMTDDDKDGVYEVPTATGFPNVIFCRMNPSAAANNWNNKWNQTSDLTIPTNGSNCYTVKEGTWDKGGGTWSTYGKALGTHDEVAEIVGEALNSGYYVRNTSINIDMTNEDVKKDLYKSFHAESIHTERTTYFEGDELWMTNAAGVNSGYGTSGTSMTHFTYEGGVKKVDWSVPGTTMEDYYTTLKDINNSISESQNWTKTGSTYESSDATLKQYFLDFTAPCFLNIDETNKNIFDLDYVTVEKSGNSLVLKLYVKSTNNGFIKDGTTLLSTATITTESHYTLLGTFNEWNQENTIFHVRDAKDGYARVAVELEAGTTYKFKIKKGDAWYGYATPIQDGCLNLTFSTSVSSDASLTVSESGTYVFTLNTSSGVQLSIGKI